MSILFVWLTGLSSLEHYFLNILHPLIWNSILFWASGSVIVLFQLLQLLIELDFFQKIKTLSVYKRQLSPFGWDEVMWVMWQLLSDFIEWWKWSFLLSVSRCEQKVFLHYFSEENRIFFFAYFYWVMRKVNICN